MLTAQLSVVDWSTTLEDLVFIPSRVVKLGLGWSAAGKLLSDWLSVVSEELAPDWLKEVSVLHFLLCNTVVQILFIFLLSSFLLNEFLCLNISMASL